MLEQLKNWLRQFPGWGEEILYVDYTDAQPGNVGLFSGGMEELERKTDILGGVTVRNRWSFTLRRVSAGQQSNETDAVWLLDLQNWVQQQSVQGKAPVLGENTRWRAEKGRLRDAAQTGTGVYTVNLIVEFTKIMEE